MCISIVRFVITGYTTIQTPLQTPKCVKIVKKAKYRINRYGCSPQLTSYKEVQNEKPKKTQYIRCILYMRRMRRTDSSCGSV